ncbi:MAG: ImmA/IrrE family metallo-endopeptidase [Oscillospiraceae bacterium]|nr:ImmA/IrrE family metallo-endopeptidase [Oscillospiraceae bacterium]
MNDLLSAERKTEIAQQARKLLIEHNEATLPIDPFSLAGKLGLEVRYGEMLGNSIGELKGSTIIIDERLKNDSPLSRCVLMHEIAHHQLQHGNANKNNAHTKAEIEANFFAIEALMPEPFVRKALEIYNSQKRETVFDSLEEYIMYMFNVTERKARQRLMGFNYAA